MAIALENEHKDEHNETNHSANMVTTYEEVNVMNDKETWET